MFLSARNFAIRFIERLLYSYYNGVLFTKNRFNITNDYVMNIFLCMKLT